MNTPPNVALVRAWAATIFACAALIYGFLESDPTAIMLGFATLGGEPVIRAVENGRRNGSQA